MKGEERSEHHLLIITHSSCIIIHSLCFLFISLSFFLHSLHFPFIPSNPNNCRRCCTFLSLSSSPAVPPVKSFLRSFSSFQNGNRRCKRYNFNQRSFCFGGISLSISLSFSHRQRKRFLRDIIVHTITSSHQVQVVCVRSRR